MLHGSRALLVVSIHAPGRGATYSKLSEDRVKRSFNSRTREGCDASDVLPFMRDELFQFTHPGGVRLLGGWSSQIDISVSIHAPGRGATVWCKVAYYGADKQA